MMNPLPKVFSPSFSRPGVITGILFFVMSLLPSLLPRVALTQGVVSGVSFMFGYGIGVGGQWLWHYLEIPPPRGRFWQVVRWTWFAVLGWIALFSMWRFVGWQNNVRDTFGMDRIGPRLWLTVIPAAIVVAVLILVVGRSLRKLLRWISRWLDKVMPTRLARLLGGVVFALLLWGLYSGVLVNGFFAASNQIFAPRDASTDEGITPPISANRSGGPESLVEWETLGRKGRTFVASGATVDELNAFSGGGAVEPIRVYVGLKSAPTHEARARLLLNELIRTGAFDRDVLVVATTTGTGFLEPNAMDALDHVTNGDVAVAGAQYSYLPSWISLLADQDEVKQTSQIVFDTIHDYWRDLPEDTRPEIYVYGLSLGSFGVESILTSIDAIDEPINGALLVGPPFVNELWNELVADRDDGSSPPTPIIEDGRTVRFTNEESALDLPTGEWGDTRIVYLQHASDPVVFFSPSLFLEQPDWLLDGQRGVEISDDFVYFWLVTGWQVLIDLPAAGSVPDGFGHLYTREANAEAWIAVTRPEGWTQSDTTALQAYLASLPPNE